MPSPDQPPRRFNFGIGRLLVVTLAAAFIFAIARQLGFINSMAALLIVASLAPTWMFAIVIGSVRPGRRVPTYGIALVVIAAGFSLLLQALADASMGYTAAVQSLTGPLCCWTPQIIILSATFAAYRSGLKAAGIQTEDASADRGSRTQEPNRFAG